MFDQLKKYCAGTLDFSKAELDLIDHYFEQIQIKKKNYLLKDNAICDFIAFIETGAIRHFHIKDGEEKTCDISFDETWVTDFQSFNAAATSKMNLQALEDTQVYLIRKKALLELYQKCSKYETFGRMMTELVALRATDIAMSLSSDKPEERFQKLIKSRPDLFQRVPQKYIANFLGISPESLSRIRNRILQKAKS
jgi:CRP-like cAMP-binding protein